MDLPTCDSAQTNPNKNEIARKKIYVATATTDKDLEQSRSHSRNYLGK